MVGEGVGSGRGEGRNFETPVKTMVVKSCGVQRATGKRPRRRVSSHGDSFEVRWNRSRLGSCVECDW